MGNGVSEVTATIAAAAVKPTKVEAKSPAAAFLTDIIGQVHCGIIGIGFKSNADGVKDEIGPDCIVKPTKVFENNYNVSVHMRTWTMGDNTRGGFILDIGGLGEREKKLIERTSVKLTKFDDPTQTYSTEINKTSVYFDMRSARMDNIPKGTYRIEFE